MFLNQITVTLTASIMIKNDLILVPLLNLHIGSCYKIHKRKEQHYEFCKHFERRG